MEHPSILCYLNAAAAPVLTAHHSASASLICCLQAWGKASSCAAHILLLVIPPLPQKPSYRLSILHEFMLPFLTHICSHLPDFCQDCVKYILSPYKNFSHCLLPSGVFKTGHHIVFISKRLVVYSAPQFPICHLSLLSSISVINIYISW